MLENACTLHEMGMMTIPPTDKIVGKNLDIHTESLLKMKLFTGAYNRVSSHPSYYGWGSKDFKFLIWEWIICWLSWQDLVTFWKMEEKSKNRNLVYF